MLAFLDPDMSAFTSSDPLLGRRLGGKVEITSPLGAGGMGRVYRGFDDEQGCVVAVKVLGLDGPQRSAALKRLHVEVMAARSIQHPNVVKVFRVGVDNLDGLVYVVMELVEGKDLSAVVGKGRRLPYQRACRIMVEVASALEAAHAVNVLHRDVKPGNIMLTRTRAGEGYVDSVKLVDFGLAKFTLSDQPSLTGTGMVLGTPGYMPPEQMFGETLDARADVYACGVTLYRLISGDLPYKGREVAALLRSMQLPPPALQRVPAELDAVVRRAMAAELEARIPSACLLADALRPFMSGEDEPFNASELEASPPVPSPLRLDVALGLGSRSEKLTRDARAPAEAVVAPVPLEAAPELAPRSAREATPTRAERRKVPVPLPSPPSSPAVELVDGEESWATPNAPVVGRAPLEPVAIEPAAPRALAEEQVLAPAPARRWWAWPAGLGACVLLAFSFLAGAQSAKQAAANSLSSRVSRHLALGETGIAEGLLLDGFDAARADPFLRRLVGPLLSARRTPNSLFDPAYELVPMAFQGTVTEPRLHQASEFQLDIDHVEPHFFSGTMSWPGSRVLVRGLHDGNQVLFVDFAPAGAVVDGYVFNEKKAAFLVVRGGEVMLEGVDGPFHLPLVAKRVSGGAGVQPAARVAVARVEVTDDEIDEWVSWRRQRLQIDREAQTALDQIAVAKGESASDVLTELHDELQARRRRLAAQSPVSIAQEQALDAIADALFTFDSRTFNPRPRNERWLEQAAIERYGPELVARLRARRSVMFEAWYVALPRVK